MDDLQKKLLSATRELTDEIKSLKGIMKTQSNRIEKLEEELKRKSDLQEARLINRDAMLMGRGLIPEDIFWDAMGVKDSRTKKEWANNGYINRIVKGRKGYIDAGSIKATYREDKDMRRQNFCFERGKFITTTYERKQLGMRFGFDPDTGDYIPDSMRDIDNPTNP
jgi:hypothetical protein